jgi:CHAT domain-containing protein/Tfp pilus assembly protein PilF
MQAVGNRAGEATALNNIAFVYDALGYKQKALEYYKKSLPIRQAVGDQSGEATTLNNIGGVYSDLGQKLKAMEYYRKSLVIMQVVGSRSGEAAALNNIGSVYDALGNKKEALAYYEKALPIMEELGDHSKVATTLNNIGLMYDALGDRQKALDYYGRALPIKRVVGDLSGEATTLNNIGGVYNTLGEREKALRYYNKALQIKRVVGDQSGEAAILNNIGGVYDALGDTQKALDYYKRALYVLQVVGNQSGEAATLNNIGVVHDVLGEREKALGCFNKALQIRIVLGDQSGEASSLSNIGNVYGALGKNHKALEYYQKSLSIIRAVGNRSLEFTVLQNIGTVYLRLNNNQKALEYFEKALPISRAVDDQPGEAHIFDNLMFVCGLLGKTKLSIFYGKQSVNLYQILRSNISGFEIKIQRSYLEGKKTTYRMLTDILMIEGRLSESRQVLDMLKEQEYFEFIRRDSSSVGVLSSQVDFTKFENQWLEKSNYVMESLSTISSEYHLLKFKKNKNDVEKKRMQELDLKLKKEIKVYGEFMVQLKEAFDRYDKNIAVKPDLDTLAKEVSTLQEILKYLDKTEDGKQAALHYLVYGGRISVIITMPSNQLVKQIEIDEIEFNKMVMNYRDYILKSGNETRKAQPVDANTETKNKRNNYEKQLYDIIFKPVDEELKKYGATNLIISLDGVLRYIPLAALWDGESYLVQRYRITILTPSSLKNIKDERVKERKILGLGASQGGLGFARLPHVRKEIQAIVNDKDKRYNGLIEGKAFLDNDFTKDVMVNQLKNENYPLVHISSHFKFSPGDETKNFILLGDGNILKLNEIRRMGKLFDEVKLLVLSACQTGVGGNGEEIDGFGELAQQCGAKGVVASLWPVADESTKDLMVAFYRNLKEGRVTSKIEALRQAQLELAGLEDLLGKDNLKAKKKTKYSHPYYWGAFIMMGNWR